MQFIVTKQIAVDAESPEEAAYKSKTEGKVISLAVNPRPQQPPGVNVRSGALEKVEAKKEEKK